MLINDKVSSILSELHLVSDNNLEYLIDIKRRLIDNHRIEEAIYLRDIILNLSSLNKLLEQTTNLNRNKKIKEMFNQTKENKNKELHKLYSENWPELLSQLNNDDLVEWPALPYTIKIDEQEYANSNLKIMFVGQETNGWSINDQRQNHYDRTVDELMQHYFDFCYKGGKERHGGAFWNGVNRLTTLIKNKFPEKTVYPMFNNIIKIGKMEGKGIPPHDILELEKKYFNVIQREIELLKPDILIFFTGPNYDQQIKNKIGDVILEDITIDEFPIRQLAELKLPDDSYAFRTSHPNYLYRNNIEQYFESILNRIKYQ